MLRLQAEGACPQRFCRIRASELMVHGTRDPHPGPAIRDRLLPCAPHIEYRELADRGHYPWLEREPRAIFYDILSAWLQHASQRRSPG